MHRRPVRPGLVFLLLLALLLAAPSAVLGRPYQGFDVVILVDQSGSMGGSRATGKGGSDPKGHRFVGSPQVAAFLGLDRLYQHQGARYRMGVVQFGSHAEVSMALRSLATGSQQAWNRQFGEITSLLSQQRFGQTHPKAHLGNTNHLEAFQVASRMLQRSGRDKVVVLLTDGRPAVPGQDYRKHLEELKRFVDRSLPEARIYVVGIQDGGSDAYWKETLPYWERIVKGRGWARLLTDEFMISRSFQELLGEQLPTESQTPTNAEPGAFEMPPHQQKWQLSAFKSEARPGVQITRADGRALSPRDPDVQWTGQDGLVEQVQVDSPQPGVWRVQKTGNFPSQFSQMRVPPLVRTAPVPARAGQHSPIDLRFELMDAQGKPLAGSSDFGSALEAVARIQGPQAAAVGLRRRENAFEGRFWPSQVGSYGISFKVTTRNSSGAEVVVASREDPELFLVVPGSPDALLRMYWARFGWVPKVLAMLGVAWWGLHWLWLSRRFPCLGILTLADSRYGGDAVRRVQIPLDGWRRNRLVFGGAQLHPWTMLGRIEVTHRKDQPGVTLKEVRDLQGKPVMKNQEVQDGQILELSQPRIFIKYSLGEGRPTED